MQHYKNSQEYSDEEDDQEELKDDEGYYQMQRQQQQKQSTSSKASNQLKARLYDQGFSTKTMPSVQRPESSTSNSRPLSAKLNTVKNKLGAGPAVYSTQPAILNPASNFLKSSRSQQQMGSLPTEGENLGHLGQRNFGTTFTDGFRTQGHQAQESSNIPIIVTKGEAEPFDPKSLPSDRPNQNLRQIQSQQTLFRPNSTQSLNPSSTLHKISALPHSSSGNRLGAIGARPMTSQTAPFDMFRPITSQTAATFFGGSGLQSAQGSRPPTTDFESSRKIIDSLSGKKSIHPRYLSTAEQKPSTANLNIVPEETEDTLNPKKKVEETLQLGGKNVIEEPPKRPPSNLDKYIELILKNVTNIDEFIYLIRNPDNEDDDPYDLKVIDYSVLRKENPKEYYTISMKGLCHYINGKPLEFISLAYWLKERETYDKIKSLSFFVKFRKWKTLKMWRRNITKYKTDTASKSLEEKLFTLHPVLSKTLRAHREFCLNMESLRFINLNEQVEIQDLQEFTNNQEKQRKFIYEEIQRFSKSARENIREGFRNCLDVLRKKKNTAVVDEDFTRKNDNQPNMVRLKESAYENLGFPDNMSYERRAELRKECSRFIRFSYLVDFLALESLSSIFTFSVGDLIDELRILNQEIDMVVLKGEQEHVYKANKSKEPLFFVKLDFSQEPIPNHEIDQIEIQRFDMGSSEETKNPWEFDILGHIYRDEEIRGPNGEELDEEEQDKIKTEIEQNRKYYKLVPREIEKKWLQINPTLENILTRVVSCFHDGMNSLLAFDRWSKHDELTPYARVLEEWDDMVGDDWDIPEHDHLNPNSWIKHNAFTEYAKTVRELLKVSFDRAENHIASFRNFLIQYWKNDQIDFEIFADENLGQPIETFQATLALLEWQKETFEKEIPHTADVGLLRIDSKKVRDRLTPIPTRVHEKLQEIMPELIRGRLTKINDWLTESIGRLSDLTINIDQYVQQTVALKEISKKFPAVKESISIIDQLYIIFKEHNIEVTKDDDQNIRKTIKSRDHLNEVIIKVEDGTERNLERFARDVKNNLIPKLSDATNVLEAKATQEKYLEKDMDMDIAIDELEKLAAEFFVIDNNAKTYNRYEETLGLTVTRFENVDNLKNQLLLRRDLWKSLKEWKELREKWITGKFNQIDTDEIKSKADFYTKIISKCSKVLIANPILDQLRKMVFDFKDTMPVVLALRNKYLEKHHIDEVKEKLGEDFELHDDLTLNDLIEMNVVIYQREIQEISTQATQEATLLIQIDTISDKWKTVEFNLKRYKEENSSMREMYIIGEVDEIKELLDESLANMNNILGSRYLKYQKEKAQKLHRDLIQLQDVLDSWLTCQRNWIYLENIFSSPDIQKQLSAENAQFKKVDQSFKDIMKKTASVTSVWRRTVGNPGVLELFNKHNDVLNKIQKELENYLETKRDSFPRFYFLSNDELLEILANSANPQSVQPHLKKCFDNIYKLDFGDDPKSISVMAMMSAEGERVPLAKPTIAKRGEVEVWLRTLQENMIETLRKLMKAGWKDIEKERKKWVLDHPGQIVATISQVSWCSQTRMFINMCEDNPNALDDWLAMNRTQLEQLTELVKSNLVPVKHKIIVALITTDVHARDIVEYLRDENVASESDFAWQKQLRYYWEDENEDHIIIRQVNAKLDYGYEYMGATSRLVITPLTDRCWMTITGALNLKLGAAPAGPAGTGKTESTKDLAKGLGMLCIVFNCSEQIDYKMMGRLFCGLAQQGAWACLDEFNRIDIEVLSVVAQQLLSIRQAQLINADKFLFIDRKISLKSTCGVFITMNPGYAGRTELPDNLKVLFRPVSMMIPNYGLIAKVMLYAEGFKNADELAEKMVTLYKLSSEQLSQQDHYDFGMRAVKSVLVMAGTLKRAPENANTSEDELLIRAMRDSNIPKFLKDDIPLFQAIVKDLFPKTIVQSVDYGELEKAVTHSIKELSLQVVDRFVTKVIQLFETFNVRFGVMLVGQTGSGKTTCYKVLKEAMTHLRKIGSNDQRFQLVKDYCLNPKSISMGELFGEVHPLTKEWNDGLASCIMRAAANDETSERKWVVFDGPVDALWIENMNTVLDDNMMLCLSNGQRIKLRSEMRMLFEVQDLAVASPATVSRCGMVYMTFEDLTWRPYVRSWLATGLPDELFNANLKNLIWDLFQSSVDPIIDKIRHNMVELVVTTDLQLVKGLTNLLEVFLSEEYGFKKEAKEDQKVRYINYIFAYAFTWSVGASVSEQYHDKMNDLIRDKFQQILYPNIDSVYSFYLDTNELTFKLWAEKVPEFEYSKEKPYFEIVVPTPDTTKYSHYLEWLLHFEKPVFVTGAGGVGKSLICQSLLARIQEPRRIDTISLIFSAQTSSPVVQGSIEDKLQKYNRSTLGPRFNRRNVIFIDDINMPTKEEYGAQPPIELLRQLTDKKGFYDRKLLEWKEVKSTIILACAAPPGGGRTALTPRFGRHFHVLCFPQPSDKTLSMIFTSIVNGFLSTGFQDAVKRLGETMVQSTIEIYSRILKEKPPIPSKFHYTFNLRDVSKVVQGILMSKSSVIYEGEQMIRLWIHESARVFQDRLVDDEDRTWFNKLIAELLERSFRFRFDYEELFEKNAIYFSDILRLDSDGKEYEEIKSLDKLQKTLEDKLEDYNMENTNKMNLVFFKDCMEHIMRISRVLRQPRGSAMLVGVGGSGKQSLTKLATFLREFTVCQIEITKGFGKEQFRDNIREMMKKAGVEGKNIVFLFTDTQIINESFLEDINNILNSGEVPNLWEEDQKKAIIEDVTPLNQKKGRINEPEVIYRTFIEEVRNNLHIVLCMSPIGGALRDRCRKFPSLVDCCTIDWFSAWPRDALLSVSAKILKDVDLPSQAIRDGLTEMCPEVHLSAVDTATKFDSELKRKVYTTPKSYLDMLNLLLKSLDEKRDELNQNHKRLSSGIKKLEETNQTVAQLQVQLTELQPKLTEQNIKTEKALKAVEADTQKANEQQAVVEKQTEEVNIKAMEIKITTENALAELREVEPELQAAEKALQNLDEKDFVELKSMNNPPKMVAVVMDAVSIILNEKGEGDWMATKKLFQNVKGFKDRLLNFNKDTMTDNIISRLKKYLVNPEFTPEIIRSKSGAAELLCSWCIAMNKFKVVEKKVEPKRKIAAEMQLKLDEADRALKIKQSELNAVQANVAKLRKELDDTLAFQKSLAEQMERCKVHLVRAEKLEVLLADEGKRWEETVKTIEAELYNVVGDVFLASAVISYHGPFTGPYRNEMLSLWTERIKERNIPCSENFTLINTLGNPLQIRDWNLQGLPTDIVSQDNSILATKGYRWPLMIDPQLQASKWIKNMEAANNLRIMKFSDAQFAMNMKGAIMNGYPVLIQDIELVLDPSIDSILGKQYYTDNDGRLVIKFGDADIDYDVNFRLYLTTKIPNPNYLPEVFIKSTVINFNITFEGLEDQLLGDVVKNERPEIEAQRDENIVKLANFNRELKNLENQILKMLAESEGNILDNVELINSLENSKTTAITIGKELADSKILEEQIEKTRSQYTDVAIRGAILYFVIADLSLIDPMYQYSLQYIKKLFNFAMAATQRTDNLEERLQLLIDKITKSIYVNVCRGLFEAHKIIFSFLIGISIKKKAKQLDERIWGVFLRGAGLFDREKMPVNPDPKLIGKNEWDLLYYLDLNFDKFKGFLADLNGNMDKWVDYANSHTIVEDILHAPWDTRLDSFERMIFVKIFRPEKLMFSIQHYVISELGSFFVEGLSVKMESVYEESDKKTPIIFVLSQGADPTAQIIRLAKDKEMTSKLVPISLGQGQGDRARDVIEEGKKEGLWILLQNCHLARTWMPALELIIDEIAANEHLVHDDFRIFLTSMPASYFPVSILQNGIKLTTEAPRGLKNNLKRSYIDITQEFLDECPKREAMHKLVFGLTFFHAVIQERKKFGPLGWNIRYEFNDSDLETSQQVLQMLLTEQEIIPWDALQFVTGDINYGGRVTDDWDRRCLLSILKKYYTPEILEDKYYLTDNDIYYVPPVDTVESYRQYIETLPLTDDPEVFGMHENANIIYQAQESHKIINTILNIQPRVASGASGKSSDETVFDLAQQILDELPELLKKEEGNAELFKEDKDGLIPPLSTVVLQEMARFNKLLTVITNSLKNIQKAIKGIVLMSADLDSMYSSLLNNQVPKLWEKAAYPSLKPLASWIKDLHQRVEFMKNWLVKGNPPGYWLSGLFFPQGFVTGVLQTHARKYEVAIDKLKFSFRILDLLKENLNNPPNDGVYVYGLFMEGAIWDRRKKTLNDPIPGEMHFQMPVIHFNPTDSYESKPQDYNCPVYKTSARAGTLSTTGHSTNFILAVDIPTIDQPPEAWVLRGTALLCQLND